MAVDVPIKGNPITLRVDTNKDLTGATDLQVLYRKPRSRFYSSVSGTAYDSTTIQATIPYTTNTESGIWIGHASATLSGNSSAHRGRRFEFRVYDLFELDQE